MRLLRVIVVLLILALIGLAGYAYLGDMRSSPQEMRVPVQLDLGAAPAPASQEPGAATDVPSPEAADDQDPAATTPATGQQTGDANLD